MPRGKMGFFASAAAIALIFAAVPVVAQGVTLQAIDDTPPDAPTNIEAVVDLGGPSVTVTWDRSLSDEPGAIVTNRGGVNMTGQNVRASNDVAWYIVKVSESGGAAVELARVSAGTLSLVHDGDSTPPIASGPTYVYSVSATDGTTESDAIESFPVSLGEPPSASIDPADPFVFVDPVPVDGIASGTLNIFNGGPGTLTVGFEFDPTEGFVASFLEDLSTTIGPAERFDIDADGSLQLFVGFSAALVGNINNDFDGTIVVTTNDPENRRFDVSLSASITEGTDVAQIDVASVLAFGNIVVDETSTKTLRVSNVGGLDLNADLVLSGDPVFVFLNATSDLESSVMVAPGETAEVPVSFTPPDNIFYEGLITITSDDPVNPTVTVDVKGGGRVAGEGIKPPTRKVHKLSVVFLTDIDFDDPVAVEDCETKARADIEATLPPGFVLVDVTCEQGSTIVNFEIQSDPEAEEPPAITEEEAVAELIATIEDPETEVFVDLGADLGDVSSVADASETLVAPAASDEFGNEILGWFSLAGTRVDLDDFALFATEFGKTVTTEALDVYDIAGPDQGPPDQIINFNDFFRFADDYGKTVANAAAIQEALGL